MCNSGTGTYPVVLEANVHSKSEARYDASQGDTLIDGMPPRPVANPQHDQTKRKQADEAKDHDDAMKQRRPVALPTPRLAGQGSALALLGRLEVERRRLAGTLRSLEVDGEGAVAAVKLERSGHVVAFDLVARPRGPDAPLRCRVDVDGPARPAAAVEAPGPEHECAVVVARAREDLETKIRVRGRLRAAVGRQAGRERDVLVGGRGVNHQNQGVTRHAVGA